MCVRKEDKTTDTAQLKQMARSAGKTQLLPVLVRPSTSSAILKKEIRKEKERGRKEEGRERKDKEEAEGRKVKRKYMEWKFLVKTLHFIAKGVDSILGIIN